MIGRRTSPWTRRATSGAARRRRGRRRRSADGVGGSSSGRTGRRSRRASAGLAAGVGAVGAGARPRLTVNVRVPRSTSPSSATEVHRITYAPGASARPSSVIACRRRRRPRRCRGRRRRARSAGTSSWRRRAPRERERDRRGRRRRGRRRRRVGRDRARRGRGPGRRGEAEQRAGEQRGGRGDGRGPRGCRASGPARARDVHGSESTRRTESAPLARLRGWDHRRTIAAPGAIAPTRRSRPAGSRRSSAPLAAADGYVPGRLQHRRQGDPAAAAFGDRGVRDRRGDPVRASSWRPALPAWTRLLVLFPLWGSARSSWLQARRRFCVGFAVARVSNFADADDGRARVEDEAAHRADIARGPPDDPRRRSHRPPDRHRRGAAAGLTATAAAGHGTAGHPQPGRPRSKATGRG